MKRRKPQSMQNVSIWYFFEQYYVVYNVPKTIRTVYLNKSGLSKKVRKSYLEYKGHHSGFSKTQAHKRIFSQIRGFFPD